MLSSSIFCGAEQKQHETLCFYSHTTTDFTLEMYQVSKQEKEFQADNAKLYIYILEWGEGSNAFRFNFVHKVQSFNNLYVLFFLVFFVVLLYLRIQKVKIYKLILLLSDYILLIELNFTGKN